MERRATLLSIMLSGLAMFLVYQYLSGQDQKMQEDFGTFYPMVIASRDILQYESIRPTDIEVVRVPAAMNPPGRISDPKDVIDAVAAIPITKGEQLLDNKIISKNIYSGLDTQVTLQRRAISIPVNVKSSVGYMLRPGNRVDLAAHFEYKGQGSPISEVKVFMQDVLVLASGRTIQPTAPAGVDQNIVRKVTSDFGARVPPKGQPDVVNEEVRETLNFAKSDPNFATVTLEVTPEQAQKIVYVMTVFADSIDLLLRHSDDRQVARMSTMNLYDVMGEESFLVRGNKAPAPKAIPRAKFYDYVGDQPVPVY